MAQQTFEEIVAAVKQAESRGKRYAADGKTLTTSPKGALGEMQVMPKTIKDPGFGVTPAKSSSPDEIARVGRDYLQAMLSKYGDTEKALVAYNWGPGATDKWLASGAKPEALPAETRTYVQRVKGLLGKDVSRETMAKKEREPLPASLPPMAQADQPAPAATVAMARSTASGKNLPDIKSMPASYQAAFALAALADAQDEEDDRVYNENKSTETEEFFANYKPVNKLASLDLEVKPVMMAEGGEVEGEDLTKPSFGNPNIRKQGEAARRLAAMRDVNTLPDPKTYAAVAGALGTRPDQMGFSVLHPKYQEIRDVANPAFAASIAAQISPLAVGPGTGRLVGAAERALEPAVRRTLEGGGKASEMLQALAAPPSQMFVRARPEAAARHADLQAQGLSPEQIRAQNLTLVDNRGNLIEEISDAPAVLQQKTASVQRLYYDMLKHPELESIYPGYDMPFVQIGTTRRKDAPLASASFGEREGIQGTVRSLPGDDVRGTVRGTLLHEGQHAIQSMEGFTEGANPSAFVAYIKAKRGIYHSDPTVNENVIREMERAYPNLPEVTDRIGDDLKARYGKVFPSDKRVGEALYRHMPGEVQADLARIRGNLTPEELKATPLETSMQQLNINPANILQMSKSGSRPDRQIGDLEYDVYGYAHGGPVYRADGSPEEGERLTPQQIERIAAQESAEREAASNAAFIAQKSGIGRKEGNISKALRSGEGQVEMAKGLTMMPQNILGAPVDLATMAMRPFGYDVEKPFMGSEYLKEKTRDAGVAFKPSDDPTLAGFFEAGNISSGLVNPAGVTRTGVKAAEKTGEAAKMLAKDFQQYNQELAVPGASYIRRPAGGVFPTAKSVEEEPISGLDKSIKSTLDNNLSYVRAPAENKEAAKQFMDTKLRDYFKTKASSVSDPLREALINGRIKIPKDSPLEEQFPQALINASRAGDVTAMKEIENRFDKMMNISNYRLRPAGTGPATDREATEAFKQTILQQMKANPSVIPDEFLLRLAKKDTSKLSKQEQAAEVAGIRQKLADNPTLFNTVIEPKMTRLLSDQMLETVNPDSLTQFADLYPALVNAPKRQEGIMALQADVPITDVNYMGIPEIFGISKSDLIEELTKINPKDLAQMSVPEFYAKAIPSVAKKEAFRENIRTVDKLAKEGKPVPAELGQFGTKQFLPTDQQGMTWREITDPKAALIQAKFLNNSIGGYAEAGTYGPLNKGINALKEGETRLFSLYDKNGHAVNNVEFITPEIAGDKLYGNKANTITQMNGNGVRTGNVVPEQYPQQMMDLIDALQPKSIPPSIKELIYNYTNGITPPAPVIPPNPPGWGNINLAHGGMIERQPTDNRRYL
jgi:hypothetical protein